MFSNRAILGAIYDEFSAKRDAYYDKNSDVIEAKACIEKMLEYDAIDKSDLSEKAIDLLTCGSAVTYYQGLQEGVKLLHSLLMGDIVIDMMKAEDCYTEDKWGVEHNIDCYYRKSKAIKAARSTPDAFSGKGVANEA